MRTLSEILAEQDKKISVPTEGAFSALEKSLSETVGNAVDKFKEKSHAMMNEYISDLRVKTQELEKHIKSLEKGKDGEKGETGEFGKNGHDGKDGKNGIDGKKGLNGRMGIDGKDAKVNEELLINKILVRLDSIENEDEDEEEEEPEEKEETKEKNLTVNTAALRTRRTTQWKIATYPQIAGTLGLISSGDGLTYYLPSAAVPLSEFIRLNGGSPLSHGIDYTINGNKITYIQNQAASQQEIRYQTK